MQARLIIHTHDKSYWIDPQDIAYFQGDRSYTYIMFREGKSLRVSKNMRYLMDALPSECNYFIRVHKSWIVNMNLIEYMANDGDQFYLWTKSGHKVPISSAAMRRQLLNAYLSQTVAAIAPIAIDKIENHTI